ncbi:MAG TPA: alkaline phosphatase family protein [Candidatus Cybelea sp.]|nr:alkaline phosphatase family protein [Candidatus Cybelea sp.]
MLRLWLSAIALGVLTACAPGATAPSPVATLPISGTGSSSPIQHIVVLVQENRTFNNFFAQFPGATGTIVGKEKVGKGKKAKTKSINLKEVNLEDGLSLNHIYSGYLTAYDDGKMDGFNQIIYAGAKKEGAEPYEYVYPSQIAPYWTMAQEYALANKMFQTQGSGSFTAHQDLIRGNSAIDSSESLIDYPSESKNWGCDAPPGTTTNLITTQLVYLPNDGPSPCTTYFPSSGSSYLTLRDLMDGASPAVSWKYYTPPLSPYQPGSLWDAFDVIAPVRYGKEWGTNVDLNQLDIFTDITNGNLPAVSWVIPDGEDSDHPHYKPDDGPEWVAQVVNAIGQSSYWNTTAIIVVWDDWGGFYDSVPPPTIDNQGGMGFRVPMIVISPYSRETSSSQTGYISNVVYSFGSIVRFIEDTFNLGRLGTTDETCNSIGPENGSQGGDMLNFNQTPRAFTVIPSKLSKSFFLHQKPSGLPVDTE